MLASAACARFAKTIRYEVATKAIMLHTVKSASHHNDGGNVADATAWKDALSWATLLPTLDRRCIVNAFVTPAKSTSAGPPATPLLAYAYGRANIPAPMTAFARTAAVAAALVPVASGALRSLAGVGGASRRT